MAIVAATTWRHTCGYEGEGDRPPLCPKCHRTIFSRDIILGPSEAAAEAPRPPLEESATGNYWLETPWGPVQVEAGGVAFGRDPEFSAYAGGLATHDKVSRRHARIRLADGGVLVEDFGSTNGTFVDEVRVVPGEDMLAVEGQEIRLGASRPVKLVVRRS